MLTVYDSLGHCSVTEPPKTSDNFFFAYNLREDTGGVLVQYGILVNCKTSVVVKYVSSFIQVCAFLIFELFSY